MKGSNILAIILGVLVIIGGIYCVMTPAQTYLALAGVLGVIMVIEGIANIVAWFQLRKEGQSNGWLLFDAIISIIFGVVLLGSYAAQFALDLFFAYMAAAWLIVTGIMRIGFALQLRKLSQAEQMQVSGGRWWIPLILGILVIIMGIICVFNPMIAMLSIGLSIGISMIFVGVSVIALAV